MGVEVRPLTQEDMPEVLSWFSKRKWPRPPMPGMLSTVGSVGTYNGKLAAAGWTYLTNSKVGLFEWPVSNPDLNPYKAMKALGEVIENAKFQLRQLGKNSIFFWTGNDKLPKYLAKRHGFRTNQIDRHKIVQKYKDHVDPEIIDKIVTEARKGMETLLIWQDKGAQ